MVFVYFTKRHIVWPQCLPNDHVGETGTPVTRLRRKEISGKREILVGIKLGERGFVESAPPLNTYNV